MRRRIARRFALSLAFAALAALALSSVAVAQGGAPIADPALPPLTDDLGSWAALVGIVLPALVALLQRATWPTWVRQLTFAVACAVAAAVYGWIRFGSDMDWHHWQGALLAIVTWGIATYHGLWNRGSNSVVDRLRGVPSRKR